MSDYFSELYTKYYPIAKHRLIGYGIHNEDLEDSLQALFINIFQNLEKIKKVNNEYLYISTVINNFCNTYYRYSRTYQEQFRKSTLSYDVSVEDKENNFILLIYSDDPVTLIIRNSTTKDIWESILNLPEHYREPFIYSCIRGFTLKETATKLNINENTVKVRIHRARKKLQEKHYDLKPLGETMSSYS